MKSAGPPFGKGLSRAMGDVDERLIPLLTVRCNTHDEVLQDFRSPLFASSGLDVALQLDVRARLAHLACPLVFSVKFLGRPDDPIIEKLVEKYT